MDRRQFLAVIPYAYDNDWVLSPINSRHFIEQAECHL
jgi:hypothetical protein